MGYGETLDRCRGHVVKLPLNGARQLWKQLERLKRQLLAQIVILLDSSGDYAGPARLLGYDYSRACRSSRQKKVFLPEQLEHLQSNILHLINEAIKL